MNTQANQQRIVIVGGGSAGWLLASRLANRYITGEVDRVSITVIESANIPTIGVGEGTWPTMRKTLRQIGVKESDFLRVCGASFKQGTKFINWRSDSASNSYYHPFEPPRGHDYCNVGQRWLDYQDNLQGDFSSTVSPQSRTSDQALAPKTIATAEYQGVLNYGYHFDAIALAGLLREHAVENLGVELITDDVIEVVKDELGWIQSLRTTAHDLVEGSFFFDCTGFKSLLLHESLEVPYKDLTKYLFVDSALAMQVPHDNDDSPIQSTTNSTAHAAGWVWDIAMRDRRGVGAVYSSAHMSDDEAYSVLSNYVGDKASDLTERKLQFKSQHLERFWEKNAVAIGLSAGFVEPLEASALVLIEASADWFCNRFPANRHDMEMQSTQYNGAFNSYWEQITEFLKFHYVLSERSTPFWQDNRNEKSMPERLSEHMQLWQSSVPYSHDFIDNSHIFSWQSFQYVYFGMTSNNKPDAWPMSDAEKTLAKRDFDLNERITEKALSSLPTNRQLLDRLSNHDFASI